MKYSNLIILCVGLCLSEISLADNIIRTSAPISFRSPTHPGEEIPETPSVAKFTFNSQELSEGVEGAPYNFDLNSLLSWTIPSGAEKPAIIWSANTLPDGISINAQGVMSGTPTTAFEGILNIVASTVDISISSNRQLSIAPDIGVKPQYAGTQVLFRFNGSTEKEGAWPSGMSTRGSFTFSNDTPYPGAGLAANFNGSSGLFQSSGPISGSGDYTLGAWIRPTSSPSHRFLITQRDAQNDAQYAFYTSAPASRQLAFWDGGSSIQSYYKPNVITENTWQHVALTKSSTTVRMYVNGELVHTQSRTGGVHSVGASNGLAIGFDQRDSSGFFNGQMKDVFVASRKFSDAEIKWLAKSGQGYPTP